MVLRLFRFISIISQSLFEALVITSSMFVRLGAAAGKAWRNTLVTSAFWSGGDSIQKEIPYLELCSLAVFLEGDP